MFLLPSLDEGFIPCRVEDILREIDAALERLGLSARAASIRAQGAPEMIRDMRRGHVPSVERLRSLCEVLDLEFFVGPRRVRTDAREGAPEIVLSRLERAVQDLAELTADAGGNPVSDDLWPALAANRAAASSQPGYARSAGEARWPNVPPRFDKIVPTASKEAMWTPKANTGRVLRDSAVSMDDASLQTRGLDLKNCFLVTIQDGNMEPMIPDGCAVLVDGASTDWQPPRIMAVRIDDHVLARRAVLGDDGQRLMENNHPDGPDTPLPADAEVLGEVLGVTTWLSPAASTGEEAGAAPALTPSQDRDDQAG